MKKFLVTRLFTDGILKGLTHTSEASVEFSVGFECKHPVGGSPYRIISVEKRIAEEKMRR